MQEFKSACQKLLKLLNENGSYCKNSFLFKVHFEEFGDTLNDLCESMSNLQDTGMPVHFPHINDNTDNGTGVTPREKKGKCAKMYYIIGHGITVWDQVTNAGGHSNGNVVEQSNCIPKMYGVSDRELSVLEPIAFSDIAPKDVASIDLKQFSESERKNLIVS